MTTAKTERVVVTFHVREYGNGQPWILVEPDAGKNLSCVGNGCLGLDLKEGTSYAKAREIARFLNENLVQVSHTRFPPEMLQPKP